MRQTCVECGDYRGCDENGVCSGCLQDASDLEDYEVDEDSDEEVDDEEDE
jgi:hypothetical protein